MDTPAPEHADLVEEGPPPALTVADLPEQLSVRFLVTTPDEFEARIDRHREPLAAGSSRLRPGERETWVDFRFHPALDAEELAELRGFSADLQASIEAAIRVGIECLPLFLDQVQLRIYSTLLMGEHDKTGRALAAYAGVMRGALDYYEPPGERTGELSAENRESHLEMLHEHLDIAEYAGVRLLAYGRSHRFDDSSATAIAAWEAIFGPPRPRSPASSRGGAGHSLGNSCESLVRFSPFVSGNEGDASASPNAVDPACDVTSGAPRWIAPPSKSLAVILLADLTCHCNGSIRWDARPRGRDLV